MNFSSSNSLPKKKFKRSNSFCNAIATKKTRKLVKLEKNSDKEIGLNLQDMDIMLKSNNPEEFKSIKKIIEKVNSFKNKLTDFVFYRRKSCESKKYSGGKIQKKKLFQQDFNMREILYNYITREIINFKLTKTREKIYEDVTKKIDIFDSKFRIKIEKKNNQELKSDPFLTLKAKEYFKSNPKAEKIVWKNLDTKFIDKNIPKYIKRNFGFSEPSSTEQEETEDKDSETRSNNLKSIKRESKKRFTRKKQKRVLQIDLGRKFRQAGILAKFIGKTMKQANDRKNRLGLSGRGKQGGELRVEKRRKSANSVMIRSQLDLLNAIDLEDHHDIGARQQHSPDFKGRE